MTDCRVIYHMKINIKSVILIVCCAVVIGLSVPLLGSDSTVFIKWWLGVFILGAGFFPLTKLLFNSFYDKGWIFSKVIGIALSGYIAFVLISCKLAKFTSIFVIACTVILIAAVWIIYITFWIKRNDSFAALKKKSEISDLNLILTEELLFLAFFLMWTYFAGCRPEAYGTEKFMDYGFMAAMMRDTSLPARDIWYSNGTINYYYGGQYFAVFLTRLTGTRINETYNIMRTLVAAFAFVLPFNMVWHLLKDKAASIKNNAVSYIGGIISGAAVSLAGNMHYVLYSLFGNVFKLSGYEDYWFPSSTRYIGHNPQNNDQCIHEFPSYSFVLGDLHAHVVNIMFVITVVGILYAWIRKKEKDAVNAAIDDASSVKCTVISALKEPHLWLIGILLGMFQWTNYWDFIIYLTVVIIAFILIALRRKEHLRAVTLLTRTVLVTGLAFAAALPFNLSFESMAQGIRLAQNHSAFYQLAVLWGLPVICIAVLFVFVMIRYKNLRSQGEKGFIASMTLSDMMSLLMGICAIGLVFVPEVIYLKDIYENGYARANTMFKLTYQAYILFGMSMPYAIIRIFTASKKIFARIIACILMVLLVLTCGYFPKAVSDWFGNVFQPGQYRCLDATAFLENSFAQDAGAIRWLNENVDGNPVVLEANGESYSKWERVSAMTGLPTIAGWHTHEWLWRNDLEDIDLKDQDVTTIYTSADANQVKQLIEEYDVSYIFIGSCERESYGEALNEELLNSLGTVVYSDPSIEGSAYIIQISR